jgi:hypothetical protein
MVEAIAEAFPFLVVDDDPGFMTRVALILNPPVHKKRDETGGNGNNHERSSGDGV